MTTRSLSAIDKVAAVVPDVFEFEGPIGFTNDRNNGIEESGREACIAEWFSKIGAEAVFEA